jgi:uncharacterized membrane protein
MQLTDQKLEVAIGRMLQTGVLLSALVVLIGGILYLRQASGPSASVQRPDYTHFHGVRQDLRSPARVVRSAVHGSPEGLIQLGLLLLIATPIVRVIVAAGGFLIERDQMYFWVSLTVLAVLLYSLWHSQ